VAMPETSLPVEFLFTMTARLGPVAEIKDGPQGARHIFPVIGGSFEGPRLCGVFETPCGDWLTRRPDRSGKLDVRLTLRTEDGAYILMTYNGIVTKVDGRPSIRTSPLFETGDERYAWLNSVQAVGIGGDAPGGVTYEVYALK